MINLIRYKSLKSLDTTPPGSPAMAEKLDTTPLIDLAAIALSPALIMGMLGSFVLFAIEVAYQGGYSARLVWTFAFTVFGAVLVARISITESRSRSIGFGVGLGMAAFVAMIQFVEYPSGPMATLGPLLNLVLIALVLFAADRLTWDCTHFDPARKASGRGVLAAAGLDPRDEDASETDADEVAPGRGWFERYQAYRKRREKKPHTPGVTILYFALAALPLFAVGQSLLPVDDAPRRRATLVDMAIYIASALGLLVTTSLMGLRRYLEERGARVPASLTFGWLGLGAGLIVLFLAVGAVLPRPHSETPLVRFNNSGESSERSASKYAQVQDSSAGKGKGAEGRKQESGGSKQGQAKGDPQGPGGEKSGKQGKGESKDQGNQKGEKSAGQQKGESRDDQSKDSQAEGKQQENDQSKGEKQSGDEKRSEDGNEAQSGSPKLSEITSQLAGLVTWIVRAVVILAVVAGAIYFVLRGLAPFTAWAKGLLDWWRNLFARKSSGGGAAEEVEEAVQAVPFSAFDDPFTDGRAKRMPPAELAALTFAALEAWARGHGVPRGSGETAREFAARLGNEFESLEEVAFAAAELHDRAGYARQPVARGELRTFAKLWAAMRADAPRE